MRPCTTFFFGPNGPGDVVRLSAGDMVPADVGVSGDSAVDIAKESAVMMSGAWLPFPPIGPVLDFEPLPPLYRPLLVLTLVGYACLAQIVKEWLLGRQWIWRLVKDDG